MNDFYTEVLLVFAQKKEGQGFIGKPSSFYENLLLSDVTKVERISWSYTNFDEAELNTDLIYSYIFSHGGETWEETYPYLMTNELNKENTLKNFYELHPEL